MSLQLSVTVRNARLDAIETAVGTSAVLKVWSGSVPANCAAADSGTLIASLSLPSDWLAAASSGSKAKSGTWQDLSCDNSGTCGTSGTDMIVDTASPTAGQSFTVSSFSLTDGNA